MKPNQFRETHIRRYDHGPNRTFVLRGFMSLLTSLSVIVVATFIATWFNDKVSKADYINDDGA